MSYQGMTGRLLPASFEPGQPLWLRSYAPPWEDEPVPALVTYVRLEDEGHVVRFADGGHATVTDGELSAEYPVLRKAVAQGNPVPLTDWERDLLDKTRPRQQDGGASVSEDPHQALLVHQDDGRYAHVPHCNERCSERDHWLARDTTSGEYVEDRS